MQNDRLERRMPVEINEGYVIRRTLLFDNKCGFVNRRGPQSSQYFCNVAV